MLDQLMQQITGQGGLSGADRQLAELMRQESAEYLQGQAFGAEEGLMADLASRGMTRSGAQTGGMGAIEQAKISGMAGTERQIMETMLGRQQERYGQAMGMMPGLLGQQQQFGLGQKGLQVQEDYNRQRMGLESARETFQQNLNTAQLGLAERAQDMNWLQTEVDRMVSQGQLTRDTAQQVLQYRQLVEQGRQADSQYQAQMRSSWLEQQRLQMEQQAQQQGFYGWLGSALMGGQGGYG